MKALVPYYKQLLFTSILFLSISCVKSQNNGAALYQQYCATCHGVDLNGGNGTSLVDGIWKFGSDDSDLSRNIKNGLIHLGMPPYKEMLKNNEVASIVSYMRESEKKAGIEQISTVKETGTLDYLVKIETFAEGLEIPWAIDFIDKNTALITERPGRLRVVKNGKLQSEPVKNTPKVLHEGQGGLMDIAVDPDYNENGWIYLAFSHVLDKTDEGQKRPGAMTKIVRGKIENNSWTNEETLFEAPHEMYQTTRHHYGCRIVFDPWGYLYFAIGDRGSGYQAQDFSLPNGKTYRIHKDGTIPDSNPFMNDEKAMKELYSLGNRNIQGMAIHPETGQLWVTEHGPMGGDELNLILPGRNYGWETITYGMNYNGTVITDVKRKPGMEQPNLYWRPSIAVCGLDFYTGDLFEKWKNKLLVGALKYEEVRLLNIENDRVMHEEVILKGQGRVRDVSTGPDGAIYVVLNDPGTVVKLTPKN